MGADRYPVPLTVIEDLRKEIQELKERVARLEANTTKPIGP